MNPSKVKDHDLIYVFFHLYYHSFHQHIRMLDIFQFNYRQKKSTKLKLVIKIIISHPVCSGPILRTITQTN